MLWQAPGSHRAEAAATLDIPGGSQPFHVASAVPVLPPQEFQVPATPAHPAYSMYVPGGPAVTRTALVALHGMGGDGPSMASFVLPLAREHDWVVIAPTIPYGDWRDPNALVAEELSLQPQLASLLDSVPDETGVGIANRVLVFGFSRGAQTALRFSILYPERLLAVASLSAGTYTLPVKAVKSGTGIQIAAPLPFGVADLEQRAGHSVDLASLANVRFWIGVGAKDNKDGDVPRQWDPFVGNNRVERAQRFCDLLQQLGLHSQVDVVAGAAHEVSGPMVADVGAFLAQAVADAQAQAEALVTDPPAPAAVPQPAGYPAFRGV